MKEPEKTAHEADGIPPSLLRTISINPGEAFALVEYNMMAKQTMLTEASYIRNIELPKAKEAKNEELWISLSKKADHLTMLAENRQLRAKELLALYPSATDDNSNPDIIPFIGKS
ncbi:MAG: hypothetical protein KIT44_06530 [Opitutaceae bacterium]|nr:hypothetical protein [Opitutaceae bacterium]